MNSQKILQLPDEMLLQLKAFEQCDTACEKFSNKMKWLISALAAGTAVIAIITLDVLLLCIGLSLSAIILCGVCGGYILFRRSRIAAAGGLRCCFRNPRHRIQRFIRKVLASRSPCSVEEHLRLWNGDRLRADTAKKVSRIIIENLQLPETTVFFPDDSFPLLCFDPFDGMDQVEAAMAIGDAFQCELAGEMFLDYGITFRQVVDFLIQNGCRTI